MSEFKSINILLVEDSEDDIVIIKRAFKRLKLRNELYVVRRGQEALDFIFQEGDYADSKYSTPGLILMDINMPGLNGFEVLERLKENPSSKPIPVVMLTVSDQDEDIVKSYMSGAVSFITKPMNFESFVKVIKQFDIYWTLVSKIPEINSAIDSRLTLDPP